MSLKFICFAVTLAICTPGITQESIKVSEVAQIKYSAEILVIRNLKDLLNTISNSDLDPKDIKDVISNSYTESYSRIFDSSIVIIEDDIHPSNTSATRRSDIDAKTYLQRLDITYTKSPTASIVFTLAKISNVKRYNKNTYVKVYFTSFFRNANRTIDTPYTINNRVAEVSVKKVNNRWVPAITRVAFFNAEDTVNDIDNDLVLERDANNESLDSLTIANQQKTFEQELREKQQNELIEKDTRINLQFTKLVEEGDKALAAKDYNDALKNYNEARSLKEYDKGIYAKINAARTDMERAKRSNDYLYDEYYLAAKQAEKRRDYKTALAQYRKAKDQSPTRAVEFEKAFYALDTRYGNIEKMEEMYKVGKYKDAISEYNALIKKNKNYSDYYLGRGKCYEKTNEASKALKDYTQAIDLDRDNVEAYNYRASLLKQKKDYIGAITNHRSAIRIYDQNPFNYLELAELRILNNNPRKEAIKELEDGLKIESLQKVPELYLHKGLLLAEDKSWKNAIADFTAVVKIDTGHAFGYYNRGLCLLQLKQIDNASYDFETARQKELAPDYVNHIAAIAETYFERAALKFNNGATDSAIILVNSAIAINPYNDKFRYNKGEYYFSQKKYSEAIKAYDQAININKSHTDAYYRRGLSYHLLGDNNTAIENYKNALTLAPNYIIVIKESGDAHFALKQYNDAAVQYESALKLINNQKANNDKLAAEIYNSLGKSYYQLTDYDKSTTALRSAIRKQDNYAEAYFNRGLSYYVWGKLDEAISDLNKAVTLDGKHATWNYYRAKAHQDDNKNAEAVQYYSTAITLDTGRLFKDAIYLRGKSYYALVDYKSALPDYLAARNQQLITDSASYNYQLGEIYLNLGQPDSSLACFEKQYAIDSNNGPVALGMATALVQKGKMDESLPLFEKALQTKTVTPRKLKNNKLIASIQDNKRFKDLLKKY